MEFLANVILFSELKRLNISSFKFRRRLLQYGISGFVFLHQLSNTLGGSPFALRSKVDEMVDEMLERGVIQHFRSPWASPIVLVAKKDGTSRFCVAYRRLNDAPTKDVHPLMKHWTHLQIIVIFRHLAWPLGIGRWVWRHFTGENGFVRHNKETSLRNCSFTITQAASR